jgi:hypothetical protein
VRITDASFVAVIGIGVEGVPTSDETTWLVLNVASGRATMTSRSATPRKESAERALGVTVGVSATPATWNAIPNRAAFLAAVAARRFSVVGSSPFWIRHMDSIVELLEHFHS